MGTSDENAKAVSLNLLFHCAHVLRACGWEPRTKARDSGTQDPPSGSQPPSTAPEDTCVPACPPCSITRRSCHLRDTAPPGGGQLQGEQGRAMEWGQGHGDKMTWEIGTVVNPPHPGEFCLHMWLFPRWKGRPQPSMTPRWVSWRNQETNIKMPAF